jgi:hypothetical protein
MEFTFLIDRRPTHDQNEVEDEQGKASGEVEGQADNVLK